MCKCFVQGTHSASLFLPPPIRLVMCSVAIRVCLCMCVCVSCSRSDFCLHFRYVGTSSECLLQVSISRSSGKVQGDIGKNSKKRITKYQYWRVVCLQLGGDVIVAETLLQQIHKWRIRPEI